MLSKNRFLFIHRAVSRLRIFLWNRVWGMDVHPSARLSFTTKLDKTYPAGIHIGAHTHIAFRTSILSHDMIRRLRCDTWIGRNCFIGAHCVILPGIRVGDGSIVAAGSIVTKDVPPASIVAGNPARVLRSGIAVGHFGILREEAGETEPGSGADGR